MWLRLDRRTRALSGNLCRHHRSGWRLKLFCFSAIIALFSNSAIADGGGITTGSPWRAWNGDPLLALCLMLLAWLIVRGMKQHRLRSGRRWPPARQFALFGSFLALVLALMSPLDAFSDELSAAHMAQHLVLMSVAAPLAVLGHSRLLLLQGLPSGWRRPVGLAWSRFERWPNGGAAIRKPLVPWALQAVVLWMWHMPFLYGLALSVPAVHDLQHLTFFATAYLFWQVMLQRRSSDGSIRGAAVLYLFATSLHASALGVLMTFSPRAWYGEFALTAPRWGLTPIEDQQLAGLIMWIPGCAIYAVAAVTLLHGWLGGISKTPETTSAALPTSNTFVPMPIDAAEA